jgi:hypothetical protein
MDAEAGNSRMNAPKVAENKSEDALQRKLQYYSSRIGTFKMGPQLQQLHSEQAERRVR